MTAVPAVPVPRAPSFGEIAVAGAAVQRALEDAVVRCRLNGGSWADVARALGVSKSTAHDRFRHLDGDAGGLVLLVRAGGVTTYVSERLQEPLPTDPRERRHAVIDAVSTLAAVGV